MTFVTMISFAIGGPAISIFRLTNDNMEVDSVPYPFLSYTIWIVFGIVVSVLFLNFLVRSPACSYVGISELHSEVFFIIKVGLAVDDVQDLRKRSDRMRMKSMVGRIHRVKHFQVLYITLFMSFISSRFSCVCAF